MHCTALVILLVWYQEGSAWSLCFPLLSPSLQSYIREIYWSFVSKLDRNRPGLSAGSVDIKTPELGSTVADVVSSNDDLWFLGGGMSFILIWAGTTCCYVGVIYPEDKSKQLDT